MANPASCEAIDKISNIQKVLDSLYPDPPVPLDSLNEFTFLISVVLSAQTTDGKVNHVTKDLFKLARTPYEMAKLNQNTVLNIIQPVGLAPKKSEYIVKLSQMLVERFAGKVPASYKELESLPGVGHKTASVIMSQIHGVPSFAVDTHVHRLALRWGLSKDQSNVDNVQRDLCLSFPEKYWNKLHLQMIYFGREYCTAKNHENAGCPICSWVNTKAGKPPASLSLAHFEPKRVTKGIVYYQERLRELEANPEISIHSPFKKAQIPVTVAVAEANNCDEDDNAVGAALTADLAAEDTAADAESAGNGSTFSNSVSTKSKRKPTIKLERKTRNSSNIRSEDTEAAPAEKKRKRYKDV